MSSRSRDLVGDEHLLNTPFAIPDDTVLAFWQWAFSNLRANNIRGIFAEWLVARLLNLPQTRREAWAEWDLTTSEGVKIEVKTAAYIQAWSQLRPPKIVFSGLKGRRLAVATNQYDAVATFNADLYIFCLHTEQDTALWDALDVNQWRFYLLTHAVVAQINCQSLALATLEAYTHPLHAHAFRVQAQALIEQIAQSQP